MPPCTLESPCIRISGNSGYSRDGEAVSLFVDRIDNVSNGTVSSDELALQLWACHIPYYGGPLTDWKIAESPLGTLLPNHYLAPVKSAIPASFPESGDYAMTLVIAEWDGAGFNRIHDYHNYPSRDVFLHPCLDSPVEHLMLDRQRIVVNVGRIHNPRAPNNISGTLALELWALPGPYAGGDFSGQPLAAVTLGSLAGGESWQNCTYELEITPPATGTCTLTLMLREWVGNGYVTRDHSNLADALTFPLATAATHASETVIADPALNQVPHPPQSLEQEHVETAMEPARGTGRDTSSPVLNDSEDVLPAAGASENASNPFEANKAGNLLRRLLEKWKTGMGTSSMGS